VLMDNWFPTFRAIGLILRDLRTRHESLGLVWSGLGSDWCVVGDAWSRERIVGSEVNALLVGLSLEADGTQSVLQSE
jgi:hypothetical protein